MTTHRSHRIQVPALADSLDTGKPHACNLCHLDKSLGWTRDRLAEWPSKGRPARRLSPEEETTAAAVLDLARADARTRVVVAGAFSNPAARRGRGDRLVRPVPDPAAGARAVPGGPLPGPPRAAVGLRRRGGRAVRLPGPARRPPVRPAGPAGPVRRDAHEGPPAPAPDPGRAARRRRPGPAAVRPPRPGRQHPRVTGGPRLLLLRPRSRPAYSGWCCRSPACVAPVAEEEEDRQLAGERFDVEGDLLVAVRPVEREGLDRRVNRTALPGRGGRPRVWAAGSCRARAASGT